MARDLAVVAFDGVHLASVGLFLDLFALMRRRVTDQFKARDDVGMQTRTRLLGQRHGRVETTGGQQLEIGDCISDDMQHLLIHVPDFAWPEGEFAARMRKLRDTVAWLSRQHEDGAHICATGSGIYLLAEAGLTNAGPAPVARTEAAAFHLRFPRVRLDTITPILELGSITMARGMAHEMAMMMMLIARLMSTTMAGSLAEAMGRDDSGAEGLSDDPLVAAAQIWLSANASHKCRIAGLASHLAVSQQTLIRRFRKELGLTPRDYLRFLRVRSAQAQLAETTRSIAQIATIVGYDDLKSFQSAFRAWTGMSASRYRSNHRTSRKQR